MNSIDDGIHLKIILNSFLNSNWLSSPSFHEGCGLCLRSNWRIFTIDFQMPRHSGNYVFIYYPPWEASWHTFFFGLNILVRELLTDTRLFRSTAKCNDQLLFHHSNIFLLLADGLPVCWESCLYCNMGGCCFIVHGVAGFFHPEMANCWGSWHSIAHPCWSWGKPPFSPYLPYSNFSFSGSYHTLDHPCVYLHQDHSRVKFPFWFLLSRWIFIYHKAFLIFWFIQIFTNFLSSVMIHATRPFVVNEWIQTKIEGYEVSGTVEVCIYSFSQKF